MQRLAAALEVPLTDFPPTTDADEAATSSHEAEVKEPAKRGRPRKVEPAEDLTRLPIDELRKRVEDELGAAKGEPVKKPAKKKGGAK